MLHVFDLQLLPDVISACLLELTDGSHSRDRALHELRLNYAGWCHKHRAPELLMFCMPIHQTCAVI